MDTRETLWQHIEENELCPGADSLTAWLDHDWLTFKVFGRAVSSG